MNTSNTSISATDDATKFTLNFLQSHNLMVLASASRTGNLHAATVAYCVDDAFNFCILTTDTSTKYRNLIENKNAAFTIGFGPEPITVQGGGIARLLNDIEAMEARFNFKNRPHPWPLLTLGKEENHIGAFLITPTWLVMLNLEANPDTSVINDKFHKII